MLRRLLILCSLATFSLLPAVAAGASTYPTTIMGGSLSTPLAPGYHWTSLGTVEHLAAHHEITAATVNTTLDVVLFSHAGRRYEAQYVPLLSTSDSLVNRLGRDGVNVTVSTDAYIGSAGSSSIWEPIIVLAIAFLVGLLALMRVQRTWKIWRIWRIRRRAKVGVHDATGTGVAEVPTTTFADVAGVDEVVEDLAEIVSFLREPERFARVGARQPKGVLMVGPPGTGKTLLARAVAGEAGVPFFSVSGSDFVEMFVGVGPKRVRELFARARKATSAIIFIDEIDAVARRRSAGATQASDAEHDGTLVALLNEMDGFTSSGVVVIAATNRPDVLDPAIVRPGRLDRRVQVPYPDRRGRQLILSVHAKNRPVTDDVDFDLLASRTGGMSGADLANVVNEAAITAARRRDHVVTPADFDAAIMTVMMGRARTSAVVTDHDREITAWHEAGHTVCAFIQEAAPAPVSVSIIPRGPAGGVTAMSERDDHFLRRSQATASLVVALGGRAAEEMLLGHDYTQGASNDLRVATTLATDMVAEYGMTSLGLTSREPSPYGQAPNDATAEAVETLLRTAREEAVRLLARNETFLRAVVTELLDQETLDHEDLARIYAIAGRPEKVTVEDTLRAFYGAPLAAE